MKLITQEWFDKAEGDYSVAQREIRARKSPSYDAACFHSQQCAEKYLKARLQEANVFFARTHDLDNLLNLVLPIEPTWSALRQDLIVLTDFAVDYRYPGSSATKTDAQDAVKRCREVRRVIRQSFGLPV